MTGGWFQYLVVFVSSSILCLFLVPLTIRISWRVGLLDHPRGYKRQESPVPYLGGMAITFAFTLAIISASLTHPPVAGHRELNVILITALALAVVGLLDDIKNVSPWVRIAVEVGCGIVVWNLGVGVSLTGLDLLDLLLTVFWVVGITNAFNLLDNMDGLTAGVVCTTCTSYFAVAATGGQFLVAAMSAGLVGCAVGFLRSNRYPAQIYMGDGGALFFGFLVAYLGLKLKVVGDGFQTSVVPVLACSIAILDTSVVTVARLRLRKSPFQGGSDHISHRLVKIGLPVPVAVGTIHVVAAIAGVLAFVCSRLDPISVWIVGGLVGANALGAAGFLLTIPVYPEQQHS